MDGKQSWLLLLLKDGVSVNKARSLCKQQNYFPKNPGNIKKNYTYIISLRPFLNHKSDLSAGICSACGAADELTPFSAPFFLLPVTRQSPVTSPANSTRISSQGGQLYCHQSLFIPHFFILAYR